MQRLGRFVMGIAALALIGANTGTLLALLAGAGWPAELFYLSLMQYSIDQTVTIALFLAFKPRWLGLGSLPLLGLNLWLLAPYYLSGFGGATAAVPNHDPALRLMTVNVNAGNRHADLILKAIE